jgi:hypothetical protein
MPFPSALHRWVQREKGAKGPTVRGDLPFVVQHAGGAARSRCPFVCRLLLAVALLARPFGNDDDARLSLRARSPRRDGRSSSAGGVGSIC